jgi:hypothetical protein
MMENEFSSQQEARSYTFLSTGSSYAAIDAGQGSQ